MTTIPIGKLELWTAVYVDGLMAAQRTIFRSASSCCAVTVTFGDGGTRGVHPRCN